MNRNILRESGRYSERTPYYYYYFVICFCKRILAICFELRREEKEIREKAYHE